MKRLILLVLLALVPTSGYAQSPSNQAVLTSATCPGSGCVTLSISGLGASSLQVAGTYSGTIQFEASVDGSTYADLSMTPSGGGSGATNTTSTGVWQGATGGIAIIRARMSSYTSGRATVTLQASQNGTNLLTQSNTWCCTQTFDDATCTGTCTGFSGGNAPDTATYLTATDQTSTLTGSRHLIAGTNVTFDDTTPGERTISASGGGGGGITGTLTAGQMLVATGTSTVVTGRLSYTDSPLLNPIAQPTTDGDGFDFTLRGGAGNGTAGEPGVLNLLGAPWASLDNNYVFGAVNVIGGTGTFGQGFYGGDVFIAGGAGDTGGGLGGNVHLTGGFPASVSQGGVYITGAVGADASTGGLLQFIAGSGGETSGAGGEARFSSGDGGSAGGGGNTFILTGRGFGGADGGFLSLTAGDTDMDGTGGGVFIGSGTVLAGDGDGGVVQIEAEAGNGTGHAGDIRLLIAGAEALLISHADLSATFSSSVTATDFIVGNGSAFKTDTTDAHTGLIQAYDVDGTAYKTFGTLTNGNTPSFALAAPSGGSLTGNFTSLKVGGVDLVLTGTTSSIGGSLLVGVGSTATGTATVAGAVVGQPVAVSASDGTAPNALISLSASVTSTNTVTVQLTALAAVTPTAKTYNVAVLP